LEKAALGLILAGAIGNLIDRILFGHVIDFIDIHIEPVFYWPVFNVADSAITLGACMLGWLLLRQSFTLKK
jgi:signal peptidase II